MMIDEALRLYPPAHVISRTALGDDEVCGFRIRAKRFDPERFTPERSRGRHGYAYYPLGGGPRMCIGDRFSLMGQTLVLAMTAHRSRAD
jgi:cytochrome P450